MRGVEDLGDGVRAIFTLEAGFGPMNGKSVQNGRLFGRQTNMASKFLGSIDPFSISYSTANLGTTFSSGNTMRLDNMVLYQTPSFDGRSSASVMPSMPMTRWTKTAARASRPTTTTASS